MRSERTCGRMAAGAFAWLAFVLPWWIGVGPAEGSSPTTAFLLGPPAGESPTVVYASFVLEDITAIDEEMQTFEFDGVLTLRWRDERQVFDPIEVGVDEKIYQGSYQFNEVYEGWWVQIVLANESGQYERKGVILRVRPDGAMTYVEEVDGIAEVPMNLQRFPFDRHDFELVFQVLGMDASEVVLEADPDIETRGAGDVSIAQWHLEEVRTSVREWQPGGVTGSRPGVSTLVVSFGIARRPGFMLRVVVAPLAMLVMLTWSVFWMDRESLGDRMDLSFIGILTVVAFQIMVADHLPRIPYFTVMGAFLYLNYLFLVASVVVNLVVGRLDRSGRTELGDRVDRTCRWIFPLAYFGLIGVGWVVVGTS